MKKLRLFAAAGILALAQLGSAQAALISTGVPVDSNGNPVAAGNVDPNGTISFYIPLSGGHAGTFGVGGVGLSAGSFSGNGGAGSMDMYLSFSPTAGGTTLQLLFEDLDLIGVNDPSGFLENVAVYTFDMSSQLAFVDNVSDPEVVLANTNGLNQELQISLLSLLPLGDPFLVKLRFTAGAIKGTNTVETLRANLIGTTSVPEPASLLSFGIGQIGLGFLAVRRRSRAV